MQLDLRDLIYMNPPYPRCGDNGIPTTCRRFCHGDFCRSLTNTACPATDTQGTSSSVNPCPLPCNSKYVSDGPRRLRC